MIERGWEAFFIIAPFLRKVGWVSLFGAVYEAVANKPDAPALALFAFAMLLITNLPKNTNQVDWSKYK